MGRNLDNRQAIDLTALLRRYEHGDRDAGETAVRIVSCELRGIAARDLRQESKGYTLQTTVFL
jgi:hypothetical protein